MENEISSNYKQFVSLVQAEQKPELLESASLELLHKFEVLRISDESQPFDLSTYILLKASKLFQSGIFGKEELSECDEISEKVKAFKDGCLIGIAAYLNMVLQKSISCLSKKEHEHSLALIKEADETYKYCFTLSTENPICVEELIEKLATGELDKEIFRCAIAAQMVKVLARSNNYNSIEPYAVPALKYGLITLLNPNEAILGDRCDIYFNYLIEINSLLQCKRMRQLDHVLAAYMSLVSKILRAVPTESRHLFNFLESTVTYHYVFILYTMVGLSMDLMDGNEVTPIDNDTFEQIFNSVDDADYLMYVDQVPLEFLKTKEEIWMTMEIANYWEKLLLQYEDLNLLNLLNLMFFVENRVKMLPDDL